MTLDIQVCIECGQYHYPSVMLCSHCGSGDFHTARVKSGNILARTEVSYQAGEDSQEPVSLALVEIDASTRVLARLERGARRADAVQLTLSGKVLVAKAMDTDS